MIHVNSRRPFTLGRVARPQSPRRRESRRSTLGCTGEGSLRAADGVPSACLLGSFGGLLSLAISRTVDLRLAYAPITLVLHGDLLDPWDWIAERRIGAAAEALLGRFAPLVHAPLPRRWEARAPSAAERRRRAGELRRAAKEVDAPRFTAELWSGPGPASSSSALPLIALAAARLQGSLAAAALRAALREAALVFGIDVTRGDVIVEVAARAGLDLSRFIPALQAPATERSVRKEIREAHERGVTAGPGLVIADEWLVSRVRPLRDYRVILKRYLATRAGASVEHTVH